MSHNDFIKYRSEKIENIEAESIIFFEKKSEVFLSFFQEQLKSKALSEYSVQQDFIPIDKKEIHDMIESSFKNYLTEERRERIMLEANQANESKDYYKLEELSRQIKMNPFNDFNISNFFIEILAEKLRMKIEDLGFEAYFEEANEDIKQPFLRVKL